MEAADIIAKLRTGVCDRRTRQAVEEVILEAKRLRDENTKLLAEVAIHQAWEIVVVEQIEHDLKHNGDASLLEKFRSEGVPLHQRITMVFNALRDRLHELQVGVAELGNRLLNGCKLAYQDDEWWLFGRGGEGLVGAPMLIDLVQQLAAEAAREK